MKARAARFRLLMSLLILLSVFMGGAAAAAGVTDFVAEGQDGTYYEYNYDKLLESYVLHILTGDGIIYADYSNKQMKAVLDGTNGYVDYDDVLEAYAVAVITKKPFDLNAYASSDKAKAAVMPDKVLLVSLGEDNKLVYTEKYLDPLNAALLLVKEAATPEKMREVLEGHREVLGLNMTEYTKLNNYGKNWVAGGVLLERPGEGFENAEDIQVVFNARTEEAKILLEEAVGAVNSAANEAEMMTAILEKAEVLDINKAYYSELSEEKQGQVAHELFGKKPFSSAEKIRSAFNAAVAAAKSYINAYYTDYSRTLAQIVDIQMTKSPQTDLYGGGWKTAKREDVEYYVNPDNFVDPHLGEEEKDIVIIKASVLNVRERPTTDSAILTKVYSGQTFVVEDAREAEPGTAPGTEGTWYKIRANNETGWVYGGFVEVTQAAVSGSMFQFLVLSTNAGITEEDMGKILSGRGILSGKESSFLEGSLLHTINEIFLVALALHETGNGKSALANGIDFEDKDNLFPGQDTVKVYNMFGIGAYDSNPTYLGAQYAYNKGWFTPELAILGGAQFTSGSYINHSTYMQNTLYKMRWNPANPGTHQYATDIGWASKQVGRIKTLYDQCTNYILEFDIPRYKK